MSVHAHGNIRFLSREGLEAILRKSTLHFENNDTQSPTVFDNLPASFREKTLRAIVGFEIEVSRLDAVFKLSQDKDAESVKTIIDQLRTGDEDARRIAAEMDKRRH